MHGRSTRPAVLVLASTYPRWTGDPEPSFVHELCRRLTDTFEVTAIVPDAPGADPSGMLDGVEVIRYRYAPRPLQTLVNNGGIAMNLRISRWKYLLVPGFILGQFLAARRLSKQRKFAAIHAHWLIPQGTIARQLKRTFDIPYIVTSHGGDLFGLRSALLTRGKQQVAAACSAMTVVSAAMRDEAMRIGLVPPRLDVLPMGVDLVNLFVPDDSVPRSSNELLFVGRLVEKKGLRHLIDAMPAILAAHPSTRLKVAGFGPEEETLRARTKALNLAERVEFVGAVSQRDLPDLYRRAAVFVAPFVQARSGDQEGLGLVAIEAFGCGCPIVLSDLPATRDVLPGSTACVRVAPGSAAALAEAISAILALPDVGLRAVAAERQGMVDRFDWSRVASRYSKLIEQVIVENRRMAEHGA